MRPHPARFFAFAASLLCFSLVCVLHLHAQTGTAQLSGFATDSTGAALPHASVLIVNQDTGVSRSTQTSIKGEYTAPALQPGHYRITVEAKGFQTLVTDNITLTVGQNANLGFQLKVGAENQTVMVDGSGLQINTADASVSTVIDRKFVENIPLNGRSFQDLISLTPGVVTQSPQVNSAQNYSGDFSVNGQRTESNSYIVDGISANAGAGNGYGQAQAGTGGAIASSTALGTTQSLISVDALQEFRVESSTYSAEYGRTPGGQFVFVTRSGTNAFHGNLFDYLRNNFFDANDWFNDHAGKSITPLRQNDFGGTFGGPVIIPHLYNGRDATFFFASYEGLRLTQPQAARLLYVPALSVRSAAPANLMPILNAFPLPTGAELTDSSGNLTGMAPFIAPYSLPAQIDSTSIRIDHTFTPRLSAFVRFGNTPSSNSTRLLSDIIRTQLTAQTYTLGTVYQLSKDAVNDFRLGYSSGTANVIETLDGFGGAVPINLASAMGVSSQAEPYFQLYISGLSSYLITQNSANKSRQWNAVDTQSFSFGRHQLKLGLDFRHIDSPLLPVSPELYAEYTSRPSLVTSGTPSFMEALKYIPAEPLYNQLSAFIQDEWHVTPVLSMSLGLRWEVNPPPSEANGNDAYTLSGNLSNPASLALAPRGTALWNTTWYNFAPRIGIAWQAHVTPGWETVVRSGGGVFFDTNNEIAALGYGGVGFGAISVLTGSLPVSSGQLNFSPSANPPYTSSTVYAFPSHLQPPYTLEWNLSLQQALGRTQTITMSYVGANGRRLIGEQQLSLHSLNPNFGTVIDFPGNLTSSYNALQSEFQRSLAHGLQAMVSYTWAHSIDDGSSYSALPIQRGNSDFDVRHNFVSGLSWDLPAIQSNKIAKTILNNWGIDGRYSASTAFPLNLFGNLLTDPTTGSQYYSGLNLNPNTPFYIYQNGCGGTTTCIPGGREINKAAFSLPATGAPGNAPRNFLRGFGATQVNLAARRTFHLTDGLSIQFRAETFNLLNHPNFGAVDRTYTDPTFGQATAMLNSSLGTVSSRYQQGGPRSMQFSLKILF